VGQTGFFLQQTPHARGKLARYASVNGLALSRAQSNFRWGKKIKCSVARKMPLGGGRETPLNGKPLHNQGWGR
jgi:hypothetical protein